MNQDWLYQIALSKIPGVGAVIARNLVSYCGSAQQVFFTRRSRLLKIPGVGEQLASRIGDPDVLRLAEEELRAVDKHRIRCVFYLDADYPERLKHSPQSPVLLYVSGNVDLNAPRTVAVVGTRRPTEYGKARCEAIVRDLKSYNPVVISGLAYGIDIVAHRSALAYGMATIGVLGNGFGYLYPRAHKSVAAQMMASGGLVTEFGFDTGPDRENFPARNRIVAGLADVVVVVESGKSGGSMITAAFADAFHKDVLAVPGRVGDPVSEGCNYLIKTNRAQLLESGHELAGLLRWDEDTPPVIQRLIFDDLSEREQLLLSLIRETEERHIDALASLAKMPLSELASVLLSLEFKGAIKALPGKRYISIS